LEKEKRTVPRFSPKRRRVNTFLSSSLSALEGKVEEERPIKIFSSILSLSSLTKREEGKKGERENRHQTGWT